MFTQDPKPNGEQELPLYPIAVLLEELKNDELYYRINALRKLPVIAAALGPEKTRDELLPFLEGISCDEDEILVVYSEELSKLTDSVGGPEYLHVLLPPLEHLAALEEDAVCENAVFSLLKVVELMPQEHMEKYFFRTIENLSKGEWFTSRRSACFLYDVAYRKFSNNRELRLSLQSMFTELCTEETPMVRRAAVLNMPKLVNSMPREDVIDFALPLLKKLCTDQQDSVKLLTVNVYPEIAKFLDNDQIMEHIFPIFERMCADQSWRVKYMVADKFMKLADFLPQEVIDTTMCLRFTDLLKDNEPEVRTVATSRIPEFCNKISINNVTDSILPCVKDLASDASKHVRIVLAEHINNLSEILGKNGTLKDLIPLLLKLLKDEASEVRLNIVYNLDVISHVIGPESLSKYLFPSIVQLAEDKKWRVRLAIVEKIPLLALQVRMELDDRLKNLFISWLEDPIYTIRAVAANSLSQLTTTFGSDWAKNSLLPSVMNMASSEKCRYRLTTLLCLKKIAPALEPSVLIDDVIGIILNFASDPVPNVRLNVSRAIIEIIPYLEQDRVKEVLAERIIPVISGLCEDKDGDISYYSDLAMKAAKKRLSEV